MFTGSEYYYSLGITTQQWQFLQTLLYQNRNNQLSAQSKWPTPWQPTCKKFSQWCYCTFKSTNTSVQKTVSSLWFQPCIHCLGLLPQPTIPTQHLPTKVLGQSRALPNNTPTGHGMEPRAMSLHPLTVNPIKDPAICTITVQPRALATKWQTGV